MAIVSLLPHVEFGPNDHREDALKFTDNTSVLRLNSEKFQNFSFEPKFAIFVAKSQNWFPDFQEFTLFRYGMDPFFPNLAVEEVWFDNGKT